MAERPYVTTFLRSRVPILDHASRLRDREWEADFIQSIRRTGKASGAISAYDAVPSYGGFQGPTYSQGWAQAEEHSKNAIRNNSTYLNDEAIALRRTDRELRKQAFIEAEAARSSARAKEAAKLTEERAARAEAQREYRERMAERERRQTERNAEWDRRQEHLDDLARRAKAEDEAAQRAAIRAVENVRDHAVDASRAEHAEIMRSTWSCMKCAVVIKPVLRLGKYWFNCTGCGHSAVVPRERIMAALRTGT